MNCQVSYPNTRIPLAYMYLHVVHGCTHRKQPYRLCFKPRVFPRDPFLPRILVHRLKAVNRHFPRPQGAR